MYCSFLQFYVSFERITPSAYPVTIPSAYPVTTVMPSKIPTLIPSVIPSTLTPSTLPSTFSPSIVNTFPCLYFSASVTNDAQHNVRKCTMQAKEKYVYISSCGSCTGNSFARLFFGDIEVPTMTEVCGDCIKLIYLANGFNGILTLYQGCVGNSSWYKI